MRGICSGTKKIINIYPQSHNALSIIPPSTTRVWPVIKAAHVDAKNTAAAACSSAWLMRRDEAVHIFYQLFLTNALLGNIS